MTPATHLKSIPTDQIIHNLGSVRLHRVQAADIRPGDSVKGETEETIFAYIV